MNFDLSREQTKLGPTMAPAESYKSESRLDLEDDVDVEVKNVGGGGNVVEVDDVESVKDDDDMEKKNSKSKMENFKYYTSLFLGTLCIVCIFAFLFLVPLVLDPVGLHVDSYSVQFM